MVRSATQFALMFLKKEQLSDTIFAYYFDRKKSKFSFAAGQYIQMTLPHKADERGSSRYFTIASSPTEKDYLMIISRRGRSSFKEELFHLKPNTPVNFFGPIGTFVLPEI